MKKRVFIVHGWSGFPEYCWFPCAQQELEKRGFEVTVPLMPNTDAPTLAEWLPHLQKLVGMPDEQTYFVGHSAGAVTVLRYAESLTGNEKVGGVVTVAGFTQPLGHEQLNNFFPIPLNFEKIKQHSNGFAVLVSDDDPLVPMTEGEALEKGLGVTKVVKHGAKHFSGAYYGGPACLELSEVIDAIEKLSQ